MWEIVPLPRMKATDPASSNVAVKLCWQNGVVRQQNFRLHNRARKPRLKSVITLNKECQKNLLVRWQLEQT